MNKALIFDIDGTLLRVKGLGTLAYKASFREILGHDIDMTGINWMGATDGAVLHQLLTRQGYNPSQIEKLLPRIFETYIRHFDHITRENPDKINAFPLVQLLLDKLQGQALGILTGNIQATATIKLKRAGISHYFPEGVGAYASDSDIREDLYPIALSRMSSYYNIDFSHALIIGDSPRDIDVARTHHIPVIAMATGHLSYEELASHNPDYLFPDFSHWPEIVSILCS